MENVSTKAISELTYNPDPQGNNFGAESSWMAFYSDIAVVELPALSALVYDSVVTMPQNVVALAWTYDGTKLSYNQGTGSFHTYTAVTPWSLSGLVFANTSTFATTKASYGHTWHPDGTKFYTCSESGDQFSQWDVPTPNDISSVVDKNTPEAEIVQGQAMDLQWIQAGSILVGLNDLDGGTLDFWDCSIPYDLSTAVKRAGTRQFSAMAGADFNKWQNGMVCSDDGLRLYCVDYNSRELHQADLSTAFLASSGTAVIANDLLLNDAAIRPRGLTTCPNEKSIYVGRNTSKKIERYTWV